jgi:hypothetical protein
MSCRFPKLARVSAFTLTLLLVCSLTACNSNTPATFNIEEDTLTIHDGDGSAEMNFQIGEPDEITTYVCQYSESDGSIEFCGSYRAISYLTESGYKQFQEKYGGDQAACPAGFLNKSTKSARLVAIEPSVVSKVKDLEFEGKYGIEFRFKGRELKFKNAVARDGSPWNINFGGTQTFLVDEIISSK